MNSVTKIIFSFSLWGLSALNALALPTANLLRAPLVAPGSGTWNSSTVHTNGIAAWSSAAPEISELAKTLGSDQVIASQMPSATYAQNVYDYVRNNIEIDLRFGLSKGGRGALVDQSGTPFDQAELMVKLLKQANITASFKVGSVTLAAAQFGAWTGLINNLDESAQTFNVDATSACQLLADGGIPTSCTPSSGNLTSITFNHIWVATPDGKLYDPAFKTLKLRAGIDIPAALGCGTAGASTCGTTMVSTTGGTAGTTNGYPSLSNLNETALNTWLGARAVAMQAKIQTLTTTPEPLIAQEIVGGAELINSTVTASNSLPYSISSTAATWSEIPDVYRSKLTIAYSSHTGFNQTFFADELGGRILQLAREGFVLDGSSIGSVSNCSTLDCFGSFSGASISVDHPYPAHNSTYADENIVLQATNTNYGALGGITPIDGLFPVTIIHNWGNASSSTETHINAIHQGAHYWNDAWEFIDDNGTGSIVKSRTTFESSVQPVMMAKLLSQSASADKLIAGLSQSIITRHHDVGVIYALPDAPSSAQGLNIQSAISTNLNLSTVANATNKRRAAFDTSVSTFAMLEGSVNQQLEGGPSGRSTAYDVLVGNRNGTSFYQMSNTQMAAHSDQTIKAAGLAGYSLIKSSGWGSVEIYSKIDSLSNALNINGIRVKGGSTTDFDLVSKAKTTTNLIDLSAARKKYASVSPADGTATIKQTDLTTGIGTFPHALSLERTYKSNKSAQLIPTGLTTDTLYTATDIQETTSTDSFSYNGPDVSAALRLGGGWNHNFNVIASFAGNGGKAFGNNSALEASAAITVLWSYMDTMLNPTLASRLSGSLAQSYLAAQLHLNTAVVDKGGDTEVFYKLPNGSFYSEKNRSKLVQTGIPNYEDFDGVQLTYIGAMGDQINFFAGNYSRFPNAWVPQDYTTKRVEPVFNATTWSFPNGVTVTFEYESKLMASSWKAGMALFNTPVALLGIYKPQPYLPRKLVLKKVSNNLGRSLTFASKSYTANIPVFNGPDRSAAVTVTVPVANQIESVEDETGRKVRYTQPGCDGVCLQHSNFAVTYPDNTSDTYTYNAGTDSPATNGIRGDYRLRRWYTAGDSAKAYRTFVYDSLYRVRSVVDPLDAATFYYPGSVMGTERWKMAREINPLGAVATHYFDEKNNALKTVDAAGSITTNTYDRAGRLLETTFPEGNKTLNTYDLRSNLLTVTNIPKPGSWMSPSVRAEDNTYPEDPNVKDCADWKICNQKWSTTDANGNTTSFDYRSNGQLRRIIKPAVLRDTVMTAPTTWFCYQNYTAVGQSGSISLLAGTITKDKLVADYPVIRFDYDTNNKLVLKSAIKDPVASFGVIGGDTCSTPTKSNGLNLTTNLTFDTVGNLKTLTDPKSNTTDYSFDANRRITRIQTPTVSVNGSNVRPITRYTYNLDGLLNTKRKSLVAAPNDTTPTSPRPTDLIANQWQTEVINYFKTGDVQNTLDAENNSTQFTYDAVGQKVITKDPDGRRTASVYDALGRVKCTWRGWDSDSKPTNCVKPAYVVGSGKFIDSERAYTPNGKEDWVTDANNNKTDYYYDGYDRLRVALFPNATDGALCAPPPIDALEPSCTASNGSTPTYEQYTYDDNHNRISMRTRDGEAILFSYDALNRLISKSAVNQGTVTTKYNLLDKITEISEVAAGSYAAHTITYGYDAIMRRSSETNDGKTVSYQYDANDNRTRTTWPDSYYVQYDYDALNRMTYIKENGSTELGFYDYDQLSRTRYLCLGGQSANCKAGNGTNKTSYSYEPDNDLDVLTNVLNATTVTLDYDHYNAHQIKSIATNDDFFLAKHTAAVTHAYVPNKLNQYTSVNAQAATYDTRGNLLTRFPLNGTGKQTYTYDSENRLTTAAINGSATATISYDYDPLGRRATKTVGGVVTKYLLDGDEEIAEYNSSNTLLRRYITGAGVDQRIAHIELIGGTPYKTFYHANHQGSVLAMTDATGNTSGCATNVNCQLLAYDEYGNLTSTPPAVNTGEPFRFTGRRFDNETGLYYYRARYYASDFGRFLQTDPIGYKDGMNLYDYTGNDPLNKTDPTGLSTLGRTIEEALKKAGSAAQREAARKAIENAKKRAVSRAWAEEKQLIKNGKPGTREWSEAEKEQLLKKGKVDGYDGHHSNSTNQNLADAENSDNIQFLSQPEHRQLHSEAGGTNNATTGKMMDRTIGGSLPRAGNPNTPTLDSALEKIYSAGSYTLGVAIPVVEAVDSLSIFTVQEAQ